MTTDRSTDEFDAVVRRTLDDVVAATDTPPGLTERLLADVPTGRQPGTLLHARRRAVRWAAPLLAAAAVIAVALALSLTSSGGTKHHSAPPVRHTHVPTPPPKPAAIPHFHAVDVTFADARHGWALGDAQCATGTKTDCAALVVTDNGGLDWHRATLPAGLVSTFDEGSCGTNGQILGPCVDHVTMIGADGYLWSLHDLYWTTDGGRHWTRYRDPSTDWDGAAALAVAGHTVVRLAPIQQCSSGCPGAVETATLGTVDWATTTPAHQQVGLYDSTLETHGADMYLFAGGVESNASPGIYRSVGGGRWLLVGRDVCRASGSDDTDPFSGRGSVVADDGALIAQCTRRTSSIRVAAPGSRTFAAAQALPHGDSVTVEAAVNEQQIVAVGIGYTNSPYRYRVTFYVTRNSGRSWTKTRTLVSNNSDVWFSSGATGYVVAANGASYYVTSDGGFTWRTESFSR